MGGFYVVRSGRQRGIYRDWESCRQQVDGYSGAVFKKHSSMADAVQYLNGTAAPAPAPTPQPVYRSRAAPPPAPAPRYAPSAQSSRAGAGGYQRAQRVREPPIPTGSTVVAYTDGAASRNGRSCQNAGVGVYFGDNDPRNLAEPLTDGPLTNQRAELKAIQRTLEVVPPDADLEIRSDSQYSIKSVTEWVHGWERNGWKTATGADVSNRDIIGPIVQNMRQRTGKTSFVKVRGHSGSHGNDMADHLARKGARKCK